MSSDDKATNEYRIDDLARVAGTTTRNVRGYQDRGLLPRPLRRGRIAIYTDLHLDRLRVINDLLRRGFTIRHIGEFLTGIQRGDDLADVLGLREVVAAPWGNTTKTSVSADELRELLNNSNPAYFTRLIDLGLIKPEGTADPPTSFTVLDQDTIDAYARLVRRGLTLNSILSVHENLSTQMDSVAEALISAGRGTIAEEYKDGWIPQTPAEADWVRDLLVEFRRAGSTIAHNALDRALDRDMARQLDDYLAIANDSVDQDPLDIRGERQSSTAKGRKRSGNDDRRQSSG
ncbi:MerR family transcriptional regulator [Gordonia sputi]|uniref:Putative MerR family transcriptional regulator n=1 Tax=Gordonia sputi NBRC 100414 TaxID=1089453 RepID=H5TV58_9ACTN|nr:MerR family transcriptional regulator [Gordonia sputi]GAB37366.1 putative MerR family transcriptional regulator [Gordonia sputi NBRC 100414]